MLPDTFKPLLQLLRTVLLGHVELVFNDARLLLACVSRVSCVTNLRNSDRVLTIFNFMCVCVFDDCDKVK
jgi:hypothetical protein